MDFKDGFSMDKNGAVSIRAIPLFNRNGMQYACSEDVREALMESRMFRRFVRRSFYEFDKKIWGDISVESIESNRESLYRLDTLLNNDVWRDLILKWWETDNKNDFEKIKYEVEVKNQRPVIRVPIPAIYAIYRKQLPPDDRIEDDLVLDDFHIVMTRGIYDAFGNQGVMVLFPDEVPWLRDDGSFDDWGWSYVTISP